MKEQDWTVLEKKIESTLRLNLDIENCIKEIAERVKPVVEDFKKRFEILEKRFIDEVNNIDGTKLSIIEYCSYCERLDESFVDEINKIDGIKCSLSEFGSYMIFRVWPTDWFDNSKIYDYICEYIPKETFSFDVIYERMERLCKGDMTDYFALQLDNFEKDFADMRKIYEDIESLSDRSNLFFLGGVLKRTREVMHEKCSLSVKVRI